MNQDHDTTGYHKSSPSGEFGGKMNGQNQGAAGNPHANESRDSSLPTLFELPDLTAQGLQKGSQSVQVSAHRSHQGPPACHVDPPSGSRESRIEPGPQGPNLPPGHVSPIGEHGASESNPFIRADAASETNRYSASVAASDRPGTGVFDETEKTDLASFISSKASIIVLSLVMVTVAFLAGRSVNRLGDSATDGRLADIEGPAEMSSYQTQTFDQQQEPDIPSAAPDVMASVPRYARYATTTIANADQSPSMEIPSPGTGAIGQSELLSSDELRSAYKSLPNDVPANFDETFETLGPERSMNEIASQTNSIGPSPAGLGRPMITGLVSRKGEPDHSQATNSLAPGSDVPEGTSNGYSSSHYPSMIEKSQSVVGFRTGQESKPASSNQSPGMEKRSRFEDRLRYSATPNGFPDLLGLAESLGIWRHTPEIELTSGESENLPTSESSVNFDSAQ